MSTVSGILFLTMARQKEGSGFTQETTTHRTYSRYLLEKSLTLLCVMPNSLHPGSTWAYYTNVQRLSLLPLTEFS